MNPPHHHVNETPAADPGPLADLLRIISEDAGVARRIADALAASIAHGRPAAQRSVRPGPRARQSTDTGGGIVGDSPAWRGVLKKARQVARTEATVLLQGESGTGKEVVARFIHQASAREGGPFVAINCAALPDQLLESELFGYERGAFTGAGQTKRGLVELASGGVLFLDEVSETSLPAQAKLLRFLQEREFQHLGGTRALQANVRMIAASNRDLRDAVDQGAFREDLYFRLQVFDILIPPLRERPSDIPLLVSAFLRGLDRTMARPAAGLAPAARDLLLTYPWPGNVRELHNALERAAILAEGGVIRPEHLSLRAGRPDLGGNAHLGAIERRTIERALRESEWNKSKAATRLGISRTQLYNRLRKYGLEASAAC